MPNIGDLTPKELVANLENAVSDAHAAAHGQSTPERDYNIDSIRKEIARRTGNRKSRIKSLETFEQIIADQCLKAHGDRTDCPDRGTTYGEGRDQLIKWMKEYDRR